MSTPLSRLKYIVGHQDVRSYDDLAAYVYTYCGQTLRDAVLRYEHEMKLFIDAKSVAEPACGMQRSTERTAPRKRGLGGCSMVIERKLKD